MKNTEKKLSYEITLGRVRDVDIMMFTKHLSITLKSGLTLIEALEIVKDQSKGKMLKIILGLIADISTGKSFHEALKKYQKYFSPIYLNMVKSGELSGTLEENLEKLGHNLEKNIKLKKKITSAMIYPTIVFIAISGLGMAIAVFVLPQILPLFKSLSVKLPLSTQILMAIAEIFSKYGIHITISLIFSVIGIFWLTRMEFVKPITHRLILVIPVVRKISTNINLTQFNYSLGSLLDSGISIDDSLKITGDALNNRVYRNAVLNLIPLIQAGASFNEALSKFPKLFPPITAKMISTGEKTGNLSQILKYLGTFYEREVDNTVKNLSVTLEPVLLLFIGSMVGTVAMSILGPIYEITGKLR